MKYKFNYRGTPAGNMKMIFRGLWKVYFFDFEVLYNQF